ncbi:uncharacterized protein [Rutidosis leptorrhynchoides]|uniref:uncharacterized protein n=1 Tax=Rutidosis leptorrhynchoides TaxID=125765 RepID=UPI003A98F91D
MESVFHLSNCGEADKVKYVTGNLSGGALTWWTAYAGTVGWTPALAIPWETLKTMLAGKYFPRNQVQKFEVEFWVLRMKNLEVEEYNNRFLELAALCPSMVTPESKKIEKKFEPTQGASQNSNKKIGDITKNGYVGTKPQCKRCNKHHHGLCTAKCGRCKRIGHSTENCRVTLPATNTTPTVPTCFGCGEKGHYRNNCPKNKTATTDTAKGRAFVMTVEEAWNDDDVITGTFLVNNYYASVLFDTGANRSYVSIEFCTLFDEKPQTLDTKCLVEMANGKFVKVDRIYKECNLTLANKTFKVDLMPVELGSFDVVLGMDWLSPMKVGIQCFDTTINIPLETGEILVIQGDKGGSKLNLISCIKTRKYLMKGCQAILAHIKEVKPDERRIEDVPVVKDFPEVFPDELLGLPPQRQTVQFLGHVVDSNGIHVDPAKITAIQNWETPKNAKHIQSNNTNSPSQQLNSPLHINPSATAQTNPSPLIPPTRSMTTRSMSGIFKPKIPLNLSTSTFISPLPSNPKQALDDPNWYSAMTDEYRALIDNKTWILVPRKPNMNVIM